MSQKSTGTEILSTTRRRFLIGVSTTVVAAALPVPLPRFSEGVGFGAPINVHAIRTQIWSRQLKEALLDELTSMKYAKIIEID